MAISTLLEKGWIAAVPGEKDSRKKEYQITEQGKQILAAELLRLRELIEKFGFYKSYRWDFGSVWLQQTAEKTEKNETRRAVV